LSEQWSISAGLQWTGSHLAVFQEPFHLAYSEVLSLLTILIVSTPPIVVPDDIAGEETQDSRIRHGV